ncbi:tetratricopeptide repeat protein [Clostridium tepidiprofundi DSM 19306]|uniref:Tetratricopeptide repeat protein n=1 Tax=Clostridium tepidiprofundi DSM 19306 TaxID=1121338 RepID=A0A151B4R1_9CLOT|nr:tetratricopeptide repeat protein [Clostridium tepidiprofundi]KYH34889.1 tetratricopeptide repeat protein [Clostridium tepidiprofundi DSM 19306]
MKKNRSKYLLIVVVVLVICICIVVPKLILLKADKSFKNGDVETSKVLYRKYVNIVPFSSHKAKALFRLADNIAPEDSTFAKMEFYSTGETSWTGTLTIKQVNDAAKYYEEIYNNYSESEYYKKAYKRLLEIYTITSDYEKGRELINAQINSKDSDIRIVAEKYNILYLIFNGEYDKAENIAKSILNERNDYEIYLMLGDMEISRGNFEKAEEYYKNGENDNLYKSYTEMYYKHYNLFGNVRGKSLAQRASELYNGNSEIKGNVTLNGKPVPNAVVYIVDRDWGKRIKGIFPIRSCPPYDGICVRTNLKGEFSVKKLHEGEYITILSLPVLKFSQNKTVLSKNTLNRRIKLKNNESVEYDFSFVEPLNVVEPKNRVDVTGGKVHIKWEKVKGAAYYRINTIEYCDPFELKGSSVFSPITDKIRDIEYDIDIDDFKFKKPGGSFSDNDGLMNVQAYLGIVIPGAYIPLTVSAYDSNDNIITSSLPIQADKDDMILIAIKGKLTEGDKLIIDKKPEEALKYYEEYIKKNPNDVHALMVLSRLYYNGTKVIFGENKKERCENKDVHKAVEIAKRAYELTGNAEYLKETLNAVAFDSNNKNDYKWVIEEMLKLPKSELTYTEYENLGRMYLKLGKIKEADKYYDKFDDLSEHYFIRSILLKIYFEDFDRAFEMAQSNKFKFWNRNKYEFVQNIKKLNKIDKSSESYKVFRTLVKSILIQENGYKEKYNNEISKIKIGVLNSIMKEIAEDYNIE